jgi:hypothetical protein
VWCVAGGIPCLLSAGCNELRTRLDVGRGPSSKQTGNQAGRYPRASVSSLALARKDEMDWRDVEGEGGRCLVENGRAVVVTLRADGLALLFSF